MPNDWIIDVISDLKSFAKNNGLPALARQLDDAVAIAAMEIASNEGGVSHAIDFGTGPVVRVSGKTTQRQSA
jgi:predicted transcriptional regulator